MPFLVKSQVELCLFAKFRGEIAGIAPFGRFDGDVAFGFSVPDKNQFEGTMIIWRFSHIVGRD